MKRKLPLVALAGLISTSAYAQSTPAQSAPAVSTPAVSTPAVSKPTVSKPTFELYGVADINLLEQNTGAGWRTAVGSGGFKGSRLGFKGEAQLTETVAAVYLAEMGIQFDNGDAGVAAQAGGANNNGVSSGASTTTGVQLFSRQAFVGARSPFGTLTFGRQYAASYPIAANMVLPFAGMFSISSALTTKSGLPTRVNNSAVYASPTVYGLRFVAMAAAGLENNLDGSTGGVVAGTGATATTTTAKAGRMADAALHFARGPLKVSASGWYVYNNTYASGAGETDLAVKKGFQIGANYDVLGLFTVYGIYVKGKITGGNYENVTKALSDTDSWGVSVKVPYGKSSLALNYANLNDKSQQNKDAESVGVMYWYDLLPKTHVYASAVYLLNHGSAAYAATDAGSIVATPVRPGAEARSAQIGFCQEF
jgi:predicted porin